MVTLTDSHIETYKIPLNTPNRFTLRNWKLKPEGGGCTLYKSILNFGQHHSSFDNLISPKRLVLTVTLENGGKEDCAQFSYFYFMILPDQLEQYLFDLWWLLSDICWRPLTRCHQSEVKTLHPISLLSFAPWLCPPLQLIEVMLMESKEKCPFFDCSWLLYWLSRKLAIFRNFLIKKMEQIWFRVRLTWEFCWMPGKVKNSKDIYFSGKRL